MMTTNYTRIFNDNLDMFEGYDYPTNLVEVGGELYTQEEYKAMQSKWEYVEAMEDFAKYWLE